jgi:hypothetical protein
MSGAAIPLSLRNLLEHPWPSQDSKLIPQSSLGLRPNWHWDRQIYMPFFPFGGIVVLHFGSGEVGTILWFPASVICFAVVFLLLLGD